MRWRPSDMGTVELTLRYRISKRANAAKAFEQSGPEMPSSLMTALLTTTPWVTGVLMLYGLLYMPKKPWHIGHHFIVVGCGAYVGYISLAFVMYQLQKLNLPVFSWWLIASLLTLIGGCWITGKVIGRKKTTLCDWQPQTSSGWLKQKPVLLVVILLTWLSLAAGSVVFEVAYRPVVSWDAGGYWTLYAPSFLEWQLSDPTKGDMRISHRHGPTIHLLHAWAAYSTSVSNSSNFLYTPWLILYVGMIMTAVGSAWALTGKVILGLVSGILLTSSSVVASHASLAGYADIWLAAGLFFAVAILALSAITNKLSLAVTWLAITLSISFVKSAGISYSVVLLVCATSAWMATQLRMSLLVIASIILAITASHIAGHGLDISFFGRRLAFYPESGELIVGRYVDTYNNVPFKEILINTWFALINSSSYLLTFLLMVASVIVTTLSWPRHRHFQTLFSLFLSLGLLMHSILAQSVSDHFLFYSNPDFDSGLTRFSQGWFLVTLITAIYMYSSNRLTPSPKLGSL